MSNQNDSNTNFATEYRISPATLRELEKTVPPIARDGSFTSRRPPERLHGVPLTVDESIPHGEIRPIYK